MDPKYIDEDVFLNSQAYMIHELLEPNKCDYEMM